jgi:glycosyltransferase involved in cell wall biosynthesis
VKTVPVSLIIASYNSEFFLEECINSVNNSNKIPKQIIIVDDCSTDNSLKLAKSLKKNNNNIVILEMKKNSGAAEARKFALNIVDQNFISYLDADDMLELDALEFAYLNITKHNADVCIFDLWRFNNKKKWRHSANPTSFPISGEEAVNLTLGGWKIHICGIFKKNIFEKAYENFYLKTFNADELIARLIYSNSNKIINCEKKYLYRVNEKSTTNTLSLKHLDTVQSDLWLIKFSSNYSSESYQRTIKWCIQNLYLLWKKRNKINKKITNIEIKKGLIEISNISNIWKLMVKNPKYLIAFLFLYIAVELKI